MTLEVAAMYSVEHYYLTEAGRNMFQYFKDMGITDDDLALQLTVIALGDTGAFVDLCG